MKKINLLLLISVFGILSALKGQNNTFSGVAIYAFSHMRDTTNISKFYKEEMLFEFNNTASLYKSYTKQQNDSAVYNKVKEAFLNHSNKVNMVGMRGFTTEELYFEYRNNTFKKYIPFLNNNYEIKDTISKIDWQIVNELKTIENYKCQKALGYFKGRIYEAWFCDSIPFSGGPWKLNGLPGLILEANDTKNQILFKLKSLVLNSTKDYSISLPPNAIKTSEQELEKVIAEYRENPDAFKTNSGELPGIQVNLMSGPRKVGSKKQINNPIELKN